MGLPNFFCVGSQKAGTTTLHDVLTQHPDIYLPNSKEAHFFDFDENYSKGLSWYEKTFFGNWKGQKAIGTITPEYMYYEDVAERLYRDLGPDLKLIFILRNPVDRAYSHYLMSVSRGYENQQFQQAIELEPERIHTSDFNKLHLSYISRGHYLGQIKRFLNYFPVEQMMFLVFEEDIRENMDTTISKINGFLGLQEADINCKIKSNQASVPKTTLIRDFIYKENRVKKYGKHLIPTVKLRIFIMDRLGKINSKTKPPEKLSPSLRSCIMKEYFQSDIKKLEELIQKDLSLWTYGI